MAPKKKPVGWRHESARHGLAAKGIKGKDLENTGAWKRKLADRKEWLATKTQELKDTGLLNSSDEQRLLVLPTLPFDEQKKEIERLERIVALRREADYEREAA